MSSLSNVAVNSVSNTLQPTLSAGGLISGLNTNQIIQGLLSVDQAQISLITQRQTTAQQVQTAFKGIEARLLAVQADLTNLSRSQNGTFDARTATSSNTDLVTSAASASATPGIYNLHINSLATAQQVASQGFAGATDAITQGTLQFTSGNGAVSTITIDSSNDTLQGLADAINNSGAGLSASLINDGSGANAQPYRLLLTANATGTSNAVTITNNLAASSGGATKPTFDAPDVQVATDASLTLGSGAGALTVISSSNQVSNLIPGVTLKLTAADSTKPVTITVGNDVAGAQKAIDGFVNDYNGLMQFIDQQTSYDSTTAQGGVLLGDSRATEIQDQVRSVIGNSVAGANPHLNSLTALGISTNDNGQLVVDEAKVTSILSGSVPGVGINDVKRLFALTGNSTNTGVQFVIGSTKTRASNTPYTVQITQAAQQAVATATSALLSQTVIDDTNNTLALTVDGKASSVSLALGTYAQADLARLVQAAINGNQDLTGHQVTVGLQGGRLAITSNSFGSSSQISIGSPNATLGFAGSESGQGQDVAGSYLVKGVTETAHGNGQFLSGDAGNVNTADLQVRVILTAAQVGSGTQADLTVSRGIASQLDVSLNRMLDPVNGRLKTVDDALNQTITDYGSEITEDTSLMQAKQQSLQAQFAAMEQTLAQLQAASSFISAQTLALSQQSSTK